MLDSFVHTLLAVTAGLGYFGVFVLMAVESSFIPFPSELVVPPAAYLAYMGQMNVLLVVVFGVMGSLFGALVNYGLALFLGKPLIYSLVEKKWARYFLLSRKSLEKAEKHFLKYGEVSTFLGRLVPGVRQLISLPAGFAKMPLVSFLFFTFLGSGIWVSILAAFGWFFGKNQLLVHQYLGDVGIGVLVVVVMVLLLWIARRKKK